MEKHLKVKLIKNIALSLILYVLPVAMMFFSFYIKGERPWRKNQNTIESATPKPVYQ